MRPEAQGQGGGKMRRCCAERAPPLHLRRSRPPPAEEYAVPAHLNSCAVPAQGKKKREKAKRVKTNTSTAQVIETACAGAISLVLTFEAQFIFASFFPSFFCPPSGLFLRCAASPLAALVCASRPPHIMLKITNYLQIN